MKKQVKQRGQKIIQKVSVYSAKAKKKGIIHLEANLLQRLPHIRNVRLLVLEWLIFVFLIISLSIAQAFWHTEAYTAMTFSSGGTYTEATLGKISSLNPLFATTNSEKTLSKLLFANLVSPDYSGYIGLDLADSLTSDQTGKIWNLRLRSNLKWSDGQPITNKDIIFTTKIIQNNSTNIYRTNLHRVKIEEQSDGSIQFTLPSAYLNFASSLNFPLIPEHILGKINPEQLLDHDFSSKPVTSGPFTHRATQNLNNSEKIAYLSRNLNFHLSPPLIDTFAVHTFSSPEEIIQALNSNLVTATAELSPSDAKKITSDHIYQQQSALNTGGFIFLNNTSPIFKHKNLRFALRQGLDFRSLRAPLEQEANLDFPILDNQIKIQKYPDLPKYDPDLAKKTIQAADLKDQVVKIATVSSGYLPALAENLDFQLKGLGFQTELTVYEPNQDFILNIIRHRAYDLLVYSIDLGLDPDLFAYYHSSQNTELGLNLSSYTNPVFDDLILATRITTDQKLRQLKYQNLLKYWIEEVPAIAIYQTNLSYFFNKNVRSFSADHHLVTPVDRFNDVNFWAVNKASRHRTP